MSMLPVHRVTACRAPSIGSEFSRVISVAVVGYFYFGYWFSRMRA